MEKKDILALLEAENIPYTIKEHKAIYTVAEGEALNLPGIELALKSLLIRDDRHENFFLAVLPLDARLDLKKMRKALAARRLSMAGPGELKSLLNLEPGAVTPLGLLNPGAAKVKLVMSADLKSRQRVAVPFLSNEATLWLPLGSLISLLAAADHGALWLDI